MSKYDTQSWSELSVGIDAGVRQARGTKARGRRGRYRLTDHWQRLRKQRLEIDSYHCTNCGTGQKLHVHHVVYRRPLSACTVEDVVTLCERCHSDEHKRLKRLALARRHN